jgi:hypothetical protein
MRILTQPGSGKFVGNGEILKLRMGPARWDPGPGGPCVKFVTIGQARRFFGVSCFIDSLRCPPYTAPAVVPPGRRTIGAIH